MRKMFKIKLMLLEPVHGISIASMLHESLLCCCAMCVWFLGQWHVMILQRYSYKHTICSACIMCMRRNYSQSGSCS